jgi:hypothetical protein
MASRAGSGTVFGVPWRDTWDATPAPVFDSPPILHLEISPRTKTRVASLLAHLAKHERGLSFAELRAASGLATDDVRFALDAAVRGAVIRRVGAGNSLRYLRNDAAGAPSQAKAAR